jgi:hypothetical protein
MTALDLINKFNKDVWNQTDRMFGDTFDSIFDSWSKAQSFPFYNVVKYGKGEYAIVLDKKKKMLRWNNSIKKIQN